jgi:mannose-6-phosphate isomerase-like protein (cupin superfamily)
LPAARSGSSEQPVAVAPDGIAIHAFNLPPAWLVGIAEGRIGRGTYSVHRHLTIEQYSYVVSGRLTAVTSSEGSAARTVELQPGDLLLTLPNESLQFVNASEEEARVLFICAPPYPPDDSDTRLLEDHLPLSNSELREGIKRLEALRLQLNGVIDQRVSELQQRLEGFRAAE